MRYPLRQTIAARLPVSPPIFLDILSIIEAGAQRDIPERDATAIAQRHRRYTEAQRTLGLAGEAPRNPIRQAFDMRRCATRFSHLYEAVHSPFAAATN
ncbi:MAG TPA: hypothetical protein VNP04_15915 [Alphaproteobacteria bacterium]|nr:hypothetical protein [Alphaproteobacteria bacterium]